MSAIQVVGDGEARVSDLVRADINDLMPPRTGVLSTARHQVTGGPPSVLTDDTLVDFQGMQIPLREAARHGLVRRDAQGNYQEIDAQQRAAGIPEDAPADEQQAAPADDAAAEFPAEAHALLDHISAQVEPSVEAGIVSQLITSGSLDGIDLSGVPSNMAPAQLREAVSAGIEVYQGQADRHVSSKGVVPSEFYEWCRESQPEALRGAMRMHQATRSATAYNELLNTYLRSTTPDAAALTRGGFQTQTLKGTGGAADSDMVTIGGMTMSVQVAARIGLI
jgi:hypothetical protein